MTHLLNFFIGLAVFVLIPIWAPLLVLWLATLCFMEIGKKMRDDLAKDWRRK